MPYNCIAYCYDFPYNFSGSQRAKAQETTGISSQSTEVLSGVIETYSNPSSGGLADSENILQSFTLGSGGLPPASSTPVKRGLEFDDDASDGFALQGFKEIPPARDDDNEQEKVTEFVFEGGVLKEVVPRSDAFDEFESLVESEDALSSSDREERDDKSREETKGKSLGRSVGPCVKRNISKLESTSLTLEEKIKHAEGRLTAAIDHFFEHTDVKQRATTADMELKFDEGSSELKARARCLLCGEWFKVAWSGYVYKVQNYKRHLTNKHLKPVDPTKVAGKRAMKKEKVLRNTPAISMFFGPNNSSAPTTSRKSSAPSATTVTRSSSKRCAEVIDVEDFFQEGSSRKVSKYSGEETVTEAIDLSAQTDTAMVHTVTGTGQEDLFEREDDDALTVLQNVEAGGNIQGVEGGDKDEGYNGNY